MRTLYIDCGMGAAGDMLAAALLELLPDKAGFLQKLNRLGIPSVAFAAERSVKCGITGTHLRVSVGQMEEDEQLHDHPHSHSHSGMEDIRGIVSSLPIPVKSVYIGSLPDISFAKNSLSLSFAGESASYAKSFSTHLI